MANSDLERLDEAAHLELQHLRRWPESQVQQIPTQRYVWPFPVLRLEVLWFAFKRVEFLWDNRTEPGEFG